jgi:hypothetical protein
VESVERKESKNIPKSQSPTGSMSVHHSGGYQAISFGKKLGPQGSWIIIPIGPSSFLQVPPSLVLSLLVVLLAALLVVVAGEVLLVPKADAQLHVFFLWLVYVFLFGTFPF